MEETTALLELKQISKSFAVDGCFLKVLYSIQTEVFPGEIFCLLGHSGCGKTTLLRIIAGLIKSDEGEVIFEQKKHTSPSKDILLLFQDFNQLFPWMTIQKNIVHSLLVTKTVTNRRKAFKIAEKVLDEVGLSGFINCFPCQLSGGMKQRAAVARALALHPKCLLMDEAFASLDYSTRHMLQKLVRQKAHEYGITVIFVTHGVEEAVIVGDRIAVMKPNPGEIGKIWENTYIQTQNNVDKMRMMTMIMEYMDEVYY